MFCSYCGKYGTDGGGLINNSPACESCMDNARKEKEIEEKLIQDIYSKLHNVPSKVTMRYVEKIKDRD